MLQHAFVIAFGVMFIWCTMLPGMIFGFVRDWFASLKEFWKKPLFLCVICQTPYYGSLLYWIIFHVSWQDWLLTVFTAAGINVVFVKLFPYSD